jgi:HlyD family secretion protein
MSAPSTASTRSGRPRRIWWGVGAAVVAITVLAILLASGALRWPFGHHSATPAAPATVTVTTNVYRVTVVGPGTLEAARTLGVTNATAGTIAKLASVGERVSKGAILAQLDPTPFQRALQDADLALQKAQAQLASLKATQSVNAASVAKQIADAQAQIVAQERSVEQAGSTLSSQKHLLAPGAVSASEVQTAQNNLDDANSALVSARRALSTLQTSEQLQAASATQDLKNAQLAVQQQQIAVEQAQEDLASITTVAPFDGVVSSVATEVGAYVPEDGTVLTLIDDHTLDLPAQIDETEISKVKVGQSASVTLDAMPNQVFSGTVTAIAPTGQAVSNIPIFDVTVTLDNQALTLRPGMTAQADIAVRTVPDAVTLPLTALQDVSAGTSTTAAQSGAQRTATTSTTPSTQRARPSGTPSTGARSSTAEQPATQQSAATATATANRRVVMVQQPDGTFAPHVVELVDSVGYNAVVTGDLKSGDIVLISSTGTATRSTTGTARSTRTTGRSGIPVLGGGPGGIP